MKYTIGFIKRVFVFVNSNAINLRQSALPYKPQVCEEMGFKSRVIVNLEIGLGTKFMFKIWNLKLFACMAMYCHIYEESEYSPLYTLAYYVGTQLI